MSATWQWRARVRDAQRQETGKAWRKALWQMPHLNALLARRTPHSCPHSCLIRISCHSPDAAKFEEEVTYAGRYKVKASADSKTVGAQTQGCGTLSHVCPVSVSCLRHTRTAPTVPLHGWGEMQQNRQGKHSSAQVSFSRPPGSRRGHGGRCRVC